MEIRTAAPYIPDHEVLRCIGKGSYGEVWLARAVTGTLRAVKVVRREDFELDRTFEREFDGIMKFEPVSREHPALVHVLHVGRNDDQKFYYYVMELGDDRERGSRVDATDYEPRTLGTDKAVKNRLPIPECIEHGAQVAEGLAHLHECGLTHRDIKPSNIIFVNGKAKLADIGLVAAAGQMTFVGTEGFVPPEGPGSKLADIYSLGMVLYEMSSGKDRLQFPELPDEPGGERNRPQRLALNDIILKACALQPKKRFASARDMALALRAAGHRQADPGRWLKRLVTLPLVTGAAAFAIVTWQHNGAMPWPPGRFAARNGIAPPPPARTGTVKIESRPPGVEVIWQDQVLARTPYVATVPAGDARFILRRQRYKDYQLEVKGVEAGQEISPPPVEMQFYNPPRPGQTDWENSLGIVFDPLGDAHISRYPVTYSQLIQVQEIYDGAVVEEKLENGALLHMVSIPTAYAVRFCDELTRRETIKGWLTPEQCYRPEPYAVKNPEAAKKVLPGSGFFRLVLEKYGTLTLTSEPSGADIYENGQWMGTTPWIADRHRTGNLEFRLALPGYVEKKATGLLKSGSSLDLGPVIMEQSKLAVFGKEWQNSLGIPFRVLSPDVLVAAWETRVRDFAMFAKSTASTLRKKEDGLNAEDDHPVVNVTREEARQYCQWLTHHERAAGYLDQTMAYRLPSDAQWSLAAGSPNLEESRRTPAERHLAVTGVYPWVAPYEFPPPMLTVNSDTPAGNLGDLTALRKGVLGSLNPAQVKGLEALGYDDGVALTAPVGKFSPNGIGLYDMSGNVWEFVDDDYGSRDPKERRAFAVVRGGAWNTLATEPDELATQYRLAIPPDEFNGTTGFRMVLVSLLPPPAPVPPAPVPDGSQPPSSTPPRMPLPMPVPMPLPEENDLEPQVLPEEN